jgi:hypothetical protein
LCVNYGVKQAYYYKDAGIAAIFFGVEKAVLTVDHVSSIEA